MRTKKQIILEQNLNMFKWLWKVFSCLSYITRKNCLMLQVYVVQDFTTFLDLASVIKSVSALVVLLCFSVLFCWQYFEKALLLKSHDWKVLNLTSLTVSIIHNKSKTVDNSIGIEALKFNTKLNCFCPLISQVHLENLVNTFKDLVKY